MLILTAGTSQTQPDYIALAMVLALFVVVAVMALRKRFAKPAAGSPVPVPAADTSTAEIPAAPGSAGQIKLHDVPPKTAAMLMAIVANKMGKPLNELRFISIKEVK
jgi:hypothetical protein